MHQHAKNHPKSSIHCCNTAHFRVPWHKGATPTFDHANPITSYNPEFVSSLKNYSIDSLWGIANLKVLKPGWPHPFLTTPTLTIFCQLLISSINMQKSSLFPHFVLEINPALWLARPFWPSMTEKQTNRCTAFTFG